MNMHQCSMCPYFTNEWNTLMNHLLRRHKNAPNFIVHCSYFGCGASFKRYEVFRKHCERKHLRNDSDQNEENCGDDVILQDIDVPMEQDGDENLSSDLFHKMADAQYLLKLRAGHNLSQAALSEIILSTRTLFSDRLGQLKDKVIRAIPDNVMDLSVVNELFTGSETMFNGLETEYFQDNFFDEKLGYIQPDAVVLGKLRKQVKYRGEYKYVEQEVFGYRIPFFRQLEQFLSMKEVQECLQEEVVENDLMSDYYDGLYMSKQFFQDHPDALLFCLYFDDFEIANPIGAHRKKHKLSAFYWSLLNVSPEFRFKLQATQLLAVAKTTHLKKFGLDTLLSDFVKSMQKLNLGYDLKVGQKVVKMYGTLFCVLGDTLAAQLLGGFKEGVSFAEKPCRSCEVTHNELSESLHGSQFAARDELEHRDRCDHLLELNKGGKKYWSRKYGVTQRSCLMDIPEFDPTKCILQDPIHILLEGVVKMEIQLLLDIIINKKNYLSLTDLNLSILNFNYSEDELNDRPQLLEKKSLDRKNTLPMTAIETKNFMILLPFMIGDKIPESDLHWHNFLRILQITLLVISPVASTETVDTIHQLVYEHNTCFRSLYPGINFTPKLHYLTHLADQIRNFGPGRNHWCVRLEAKHGLIKAKKWKNFKAIHKSVAIYHQRWMCLQQCSYGESSEVYLYSGDTVKDGFSVQSENMAANLKHDIERLGVKIPKTFMKTMHVSIRGISYKPGKVIIVNKEEEPLFGMIKNIYVIDHMKFLEFAHLEIACFNNTINSFECLETQRHAIIPVKSLVYKWPQIVHYFKHKLQVMLYNVDFGWN